jgi:hypothetical protein
MATSRVNLDVTQYVRVTSDPLTPSSLLLQSHRDTVRVAFSTVKPARSNDVFHELGGEHPPLNLPMVEVVVWALAMTERSALTVTEQRVPPGPQLSAYSELITVSPTFRAQITGQYGFIPSVFRVSLGGTVEVNNSMFEASTGVSANGVSAISTNEQVSVKAGQGIVGKISAVFDTPAENNTQFAALQTSGSLIGFGYNGLEYGIGFANGGKLEIYELTITVGAGALETAIITINGTPYNVDITNSSIEENAYEIAESLNSQVNGFSFASNGAVVTTLGLLPEIGGGLYDFSSGTAVAAFNLIGSNAIPTERWTVKADWSERPDFIINPQMGNEYKVSYPYLGFGNTHFSIKDRDTGEFVLVHIDKYADRNVLPSVEVPTFRCGWASRNTGNTSNIKVSGAGASIETEGEYTVHGQPNGVCHTQSVSNGLPPTNILTIRNRMLFGDKTNRTNMFLKDLSLSTESTKITTFYVYKNAITSGFFDYNFFDEPNSLAEVANNSVAITSTNSIRCYSTRTELEKDLSKVMEELQPMDSITIAATFPSGNVADIEAAIGWEDDL